MGIEIYGIGTHFATSEDSDPTYVKQQLSIFNKTYKKIIEAGWHFEYVHTANSASIINYPEAHFNLVRPGISLYGYNTSKMYPDKVDLRPVMDLKSEVLFVHKLNAGDSIGYGRRFIAEKPTNIAVIPLGYGDGAFCSLSENVDCLINGKRYRIAGSVCMDQIFVILGEDTAAPGDEVVLLGSQGKESIYVQEIAEKVNTIPYEVLTAIQVRVPRILVEK